MGAPQFFVSCGRRCRETAGGPCCWPVPTATRRAVTSTAGSGTAFRDGQTESGVSVGDAGLVLDCATPPKAAICARAQTNEVNQPSGVRFQSRVQSHDKGSRPTGSQSLNRLAELAMKEGLAAELPTFQRSVKRTALQNQLRPYSRQALSVLSLAFAAATVCHCILVGASAPPHSSGRT